MTTQRTTRSRSVSRRTALAGLGAGGLGLALATRGPGASAQDTTASHPLVGAWLALTPQAAPAIFGSDGTVVLGFPASQAGAQDVEFVGPALGTWEPTGERSGRFTVVQALSDATGAFSGTVTIDGGQPMVSEDGQTFIDDRSGVTVTVRDPANNVVAVIPFDASLPPLTATRMGMGSPGFPEATPEATPAT